MGCVRLSHLWGFPIMLIKNYVHRGWYSLKYVLFCPCEPQGPSRRSSAIYPPTPPPGIHSCLLVPSSWRLLLMVQSFACWSTSWEGGGRRGCLRALPRRHPLSSLTYFRILEIQATLLTPPSLVLVSIETLIEVEHGEIGERRPIP